MFRIILLTSALISLGGSAALAEQADLPMRPSDTVRICEGCHGPGGDSTVSSVPRLNGQQAAYILARLQDFQNPAKEAPHASHNMPQEVVNLPEVSRAAISRYFSDQTPTPANSSFVESAGQLLFETGYPSADIPACRSCHGAHGEGAGSVPRLTGQHAEYLEDQLWVFKFGLRQHAVMRANTNKMTSEQIHALVTYLANN